MQQKTRLCQGGDAGEADWWEVSLMDKWQDCCISGVLIAALRENDGNDALFLVTEVMLHVCLSFHSSRLCYRFSVKREE